MSGGKHLGRGDHVEWRGEQMMDRGDHMGWGQSSVISLPVCHAACQNNPVKLLYCYVTDQLQ